MNLDDKIQVSSTKEGLVEAVKQFIKDLKEKLLKDITVDGWLNKEIIKTIDELAGEGLI